MRDRRLPVREGQFEVVDHTGRGIEDADLLVGVAVQNDELAVVENAKVPKAELPQRSCKLFIARRESSGIGRAGGVGDVQVPPARAVADRVEVIRVGPSRFKDGFVLTAEDAAPRINHATRQLADAQLRGVPWHVRVVPCDPRELLAVR